MEIRFICTIDEENKTAVLEDERKRIKLNITNPDTVQRWINTVKPPQKKDEEMVINI